MHILFSRNTYHNNYCSNTSISELQNFFREKLLYNSTHAQIIPHFRHMGARPRYVSKVKGSTEPIFSIFSNRPHYYQKKCHATDLNSLIQLTNEWIFPTLSQPQALRSSQEVMERSKSYILLEALFVLSFPCLHWYLNYIL